MRGLLGANRHLVVALRDALLERHELVGHEITAVLEAARERHQAASTRSPRVALVPDPSTEADDRSAVIDLRDTLTARPT